MPNARSGLALLFGSFVILGAVGCPSAAPPKVVDIESIDAGSAGSNATTVRDSTTPGSTPIPAKGSAGGKPRGPKAPPFSLDSVMGGGKVTIPEGKVVIVDFWATWCAPCKKSFPKLQELYVKYKSSGLEIIAISVDDDKKGVPGFVKANGDAKFLVVWDKDHAVANAFKPDSMPTTFILDKSGNIAHMHKGYRDGEIDEMEKEIKALF